MVPWPMTATRPWLLPDSDRRYGSADGMTHVRVLIGERRTRVSAPNVPPTKGPAEVWYRPRSTPRERRSKRRAAATVVRRSRFR